ncbi:MAG: glycosyltransferase family 9 protein [Planctomycetales bacterium]|nr:glycosyltransferase family 9 protein [Planctomycetales bacterium]
MQTKLAKLAIANHAARKPATIGVLMPTWIGDACMATPALRALRSGFPHARLVGVMRPVVGDLMSGLQTNCGQRCFDQVVCFQKTMLGRLHLAIRLRKERMDVALLLTNSFWSAAAMRLAGARRIVGYARDARRLLLTDPVHTNDRVDQLPLVDSYLRLTSWLGCDTRERRMTLAVSEDARRQADELWTDLQFDLSRPTLVLNNSSASDPGRVWSADRVLELAKRVANELDWQVLLHCGPAERQSANAIAQRAGDVRIASMGASSNGVVRHLPVSLSKAVLERADLVLTSDSGPRHMAVALDRKVITLYGSTTPNATQTYNMPEYPLLAPSGANNGTANSINQINVEAVMQQIRCLAQCRRQAA